MKRYLVIQERKTIFFLNWALDLIAELALMLYWELYSENQGLDN